MKEELRLIVLTVGTASSMRLVGFSRSVTANRQGYFGFIHKGYLLSLGRLWWSKLSL